MKLSYLSFPREYLMSEMSICLNSRRYSLTLLSAVTAGKGISHGYLKAWCCSICVNLSQEKYHCNQWTVQLYRKQDKGAQNTLCFAHLSFFINFPGFISFSLFLKMKDCKELQLETALSQGTTLESMCLSLSIVLKLPTRTWAEGTRSWCIIALSLLWFVA